MKKRIAFISLLLAALLCAASCGEAVPQIEGYVWRMESAQSGENGQIIADSTNTNLTLTAKDGVLTLTNASQNTVYSGTYTVSQKAPREYIYEITLGSVQGHAVCAMTTYADGTKEPTFIINIGGEYALNFKAE